MLGIVGFILVGPRVSAVRVGPFPLVLCILVIKVAVCLLAFQAGQFTRSLAVGSWLLERNYPYRGP